MGFIAMKALAGGLITNSRAAFAFMSGFDNAVPIWGVQHEHELEEWLSYFNEAPELNDELRSVIEKRQKKSFRRISAAAADIVCHVRRAL